MINRSEPLSTELKVQLEKVLHLNLGNVDFGLEINQEYLSEISKQLLKEANIEFNENKTIVPPCTIVEKHPYLDHYPINNSYTKFIIGTFPPISYLLEKEPFESHQNLHFNFGGKKISRPQVPFFHGNRMHFWNLLIDELSEGKQIGRLTKKTAIVNFLNAYKINYSDIISYCQRLAFNADDSGLRNIVLNNKLINVLVNQGHTQSSILVFITGSPLELSGLIINEEGFPFKTSQPFDMFLFLILKAGHEVNLSIDGNSWMVVNAENRKTINETYLLKVIFYLKIKNRVFIVVIGPSPVPRACKHIIIKRWLRQNPGKTCAHFKKLIYRTALLENNLEALFALNHLT